MQINWLTHSYHRADGYGRMCQALIRHLMARGVVITPISMEAVKWDGWIRQAAGMDFSRPTITMTPGYNVRALPGIQWAFSMYESDRIPDSWVTNFNEHCQRVIVPSDWCKDVFENSGVKVPISVVLGGTDPAVYPMVNIPRGNRPYTFMALGDRGSRKGWDTVWQAFFDTFTNNEDVRLIVKSRKNSLSYLSTVKDLDHRVTFWKEDTLTLFDALILADCFVFPSKAEGWGMPPREATMMGIPAIVPRYSGLTHGIDSWATRIIETSITATATIEGGGDWIRPDLNETAAHMRWCFDNQLEAKTKALSGARWLRENQTYNQSADALVKLLKENI